MEPPGPGRPASGRQRRRGRNSSDQQVVDTSGRSSRVGGGGQNKGKGKSSRHELGEAAPPSVGASVPRLLEQLESLADNLFDQLETLPLETLQRRLPRLQHLMARVGDHEVARAEPPGTSAAEPPRTSAPEPPRTAAPEPPRTSAPEPPMASVPEGASSRRSASKRVLVCSDEEQSTRILLAAILSFHGSLAPRHSNYEIFHGWRTSRPRCAGGFGFGAPGYWAELTSTSVVCHAWMSVNKGHQFWERIERHDFETRVSANRRVAADESIEWEGRLYALAACDAVNSFRQAVEGRGLQEASAKMKRKMMAEYNDSDDEESELVETPPPTVSPSTWLASPSHGGPALKAPPRNVLFATSSAIDLFDFDPSDAEYLVIVVCMLNAVLGGAIGIARFLNEKYRTRHLWDAPFDQKGTTLLTVSVGHACRHACLQAPVRGIEALLAHIRPGTADLSIRVRGSNGHILHIAAARGHLPLVKVLVKAGAKPHLRTKDELREEQGRGYTPKDYAQNRGHRDVVAFLEGELRRSRPRLLDLTRRDVRLGTLIHFDVEKGFGFIEPACDNGDALRSEHDFESVFVHSSVLRDALAFDAQPSQLSRSRQSEYFPMPGQKIAWLQTRAQKGPKAVQCADGHDGSYLEFLYTSKEEARRVWLDYKRSLDQDMYDDFFY